MRMYYYKYMDLWLNCRAKSKKEVAQMFVNSEAAPDEILTEKEAQRRADRGDQELADYMECAFMCSLMCN